MKSKQSVSIIIPTKNRARDLTETVRTVLAQTLTPNEIIIIDQSDGLESRDSVNRLYQDWSSTSRLCHLNHILDSNLTGLTSARNRGIAAAHSDIVLFLDDDVLLEEDFLSELMKVYEDHPAAIGVSGVITNYTRPGLPYRLWSSVFMRGPLNDDRQPVYWAAATTRTRQPVRVSRLGGGLMSFRKKAIKATKFDEHLSGVADGEDVDFTVRLGRNALLLIAPAARLVHNQSPSGRERAHWLRRHARGMVYLYTRNWGHGFKNRICTAWLNTGYALVATMASFRRGSIEPWRSFLEGRREGIAAGGNAVRP